MADRRRLRLLVVGISWPMETFLDRLLFGLGNAGVDVTLACSTKPEAEWFSHSSRKWLRTPTWEGFIPIRLFRLGWMMLMAFIRASGDVLTVVPHVQQAMGTVAKMRAWYRFLPFCGHRWDVIYFPWNSAAIHYSPLFEWGCSTVVSCRGSQVNVAPHNPRRQAHREGLQITFNKATAIHCVSEAIMREAMQYGLDPTKTRIIRAAVDPEIFFPRSDGKGAHKELKVITVGSLVWVKGLEYALQAIRLLLDQDIPVRFDIIGEGPESQRILYGIYDLGIENHVQLHGRLSSQVVRDHLQEADVFLLSSLSEGVSNAALEAMACGLPVVTSDCGGMREAIRDGMEGFVVPIRDPVSMAQALKVLWEKPELRRRMGQACRERIQSSFTLDKQVRHFKSLFQHVTSDTG